jgi:putative Mn2+ efflux pump MntP
LSDYYFLVNLAVGTGIAADAVLATIGRAQTLRNFRDALKWACAIGLTHWLFPMIGFLGGWYLAAHSGARAVVYGVGGAILLTFVFRVLHERSVTTGAEDARMSTVSFWLAVWGVSIDALVTGPGKSAATAHWTAAEVMLSFPLVGGVVFGLVLLSTIPAMMLHRMIRNVPMKSRRILSVFFVVATWVEVLVFAWFAMLSAVEAGGALHLWTPTYALASECAIVLGVVLLAVYGRRVRRGQTEAANAVVG